MILPEKPQNLYLGASRLLWRLQSTKLLVFFPGSRTGNVPRRCHLHRHGLIGCRSVAIPRTHTSRARSVAILNVTTQRRVVLTLEVKPSYT